MPWAHFTVRHSGGEDFYMLLIWEGTLLITDFDGSESGRCSFLLPLCSQQRLTVVEWYSSKFQCVWWRGWDNAFCFWGGLPVTDTHGVSRCLMLQGRKLFWVTKQGCLAQLWYFRYPTQLPAVMPEDPGSPAAYVWTLRGCISKFRASQEVSEPLLRSEIPPSPTSSNTHTHTCTHRELPQLSSH